MSGIFVDKYRNKIAINHDKYTDDLFLGKGLSEYSPEFVARSLNSRSI